MPAIQPILLGLGSLLALSGSSAPQGRDVAHLQEMLHNHQSPQGQSQAALLLVQCTQEGAEKTVREGLRSVENTEVFLALTAAVRLQQDRRFVEELFAALSTAPAAVRQAAAEALAVVADSALVPRLNRLAADKGTNAMVRQTALWTLGHCGSKEAAGVLIEHLRDENEFLRRAAAAALHDLSGQNFALDASRWRTWWERNKDLTNERWLETRLAYQTSRASRLRDDLARSHAQLLRLQQQLYSRLSGSERIGHIQSLLDQDDPAVRALAVSWSIELLPAVEKTQQGVLMRVLLRLSQDRTVEVQRAAVLALGRVGEPAVFDRLQRLANAESPAVRTAALHALCLHVRGDVADTASRRKLVMPLLQKALEDPAVEVVVEAAEDLGVLGTHEAGPVLAALLHHSSETVRQAAAQALERIAEPPVMPALLVALEDPCATVRFNLVGALAHAAGDGANLSEPQRTELLTRLEQLLLRDSDPGVRSRAATVLGECGSPTQLAALWRCVLTGEDGRVQDKAWIAFLDILARAGQLSLLQEWDRSLTAARQGPRRLQLLNEIIARWQRHPPRKDVIVASQDLLVQAQIELGKWSAAAPLLRDLLARPASEVELNRRLDWLLKVGQQALHEGNRTEAMRAVETAQPFLPQASKLSDSFEELRKQAAP